MNERTAAKRQPRPVYYTRDQLDDQCEQIIVGFCMARYWQELNPIPTEALLQLLEEYTHDVEQTADLPDGINGVTEYYWDRKPTVKIDARLTQQHWRETRRRTTLCHECSHAIQHALYGALWVLKIPVTGRSHNRVGASTTSENFTIGGTPGWNGRHVTCPEGF
jgi:hypothetical protein